MTPTLEQSAIINLDLKPGEATKVIAYAGTGKTTTLAEYAKAHRGANILYLAFNKSVETDAKRRFPLNTVSKTIHALAYSVCGAKYMDVVGGLKSYQITKHCHCQLYLASIIRNSLDNWLNSADDLPTVAHVVEDELGLLPPGYEDRVIAEIGTLFRAMVDEILPMTHNGYLKQYQLTKPQLRWDTILLDEAQDTNPVTLALVMNQPHARVILCGDPYQQIYSWRGAIDAMTKVDAPTLRLTKSFRFGANICSYANKLLSSLLGETIPVEGTEQSSDPNPKRATIHRTNSGLFDSAVSLLQSSSPFSVVGETRFGYLLDDVLDVYYLSVGKTSQIKSKVYKWEKSYQGLIEKATLSLDYELQQKIAMVDKHKSNIPDYVRQIRDLIKGEALCDTVLVTGHQAKGLEWSTVTLASDFPSLQNVLGKTKTVLPKADKNSEDHLAREEANLLYVACTRAKQILNAGHSVERFMREGTV